MVYELNATGLYEVFVLDLFPPSDDQKFPPEVHFLQVDLTNRQNVIAAFKGQDFFPFHECRVFCRYSHRLSCGDGYSDWKQRSEPEFDAQSECRRDAKRDRRMHSKRRRETDLYVYGFRRL